MQHALVTEPRRVVVGLALAALALGACGTPPTKTTAAPVTTLAGAAPVAVPGAPTTAVPGAPTTPPTTVSSKPECVAMSGFQLVQYSAVMVPAEQRAPWIAKSKETAATAKAAIPTLATAIETLDSLTEKTATGTLSPAELETTKKASQDLDAWWKQTCL